MRNPLIRPILSQLRDHPDGISEFELLKSLKASLPELNDLAEDPNLQLFRQHFLIMNALYQLQTSLWSEEQLQLDINPTVIRLHKVQLNQSTGSAEVNDSVDAKLATYYLDWSEYENTDKEEVQRLLDSFYNGLVNEDEREAALSTLCIDEPTPTKDIIKRQYRKLAHQAHPDRGGDTETFISLRQAYECLMH
ncbi:DNA-J related domain-containing protein [Marinomonas mediterranea]|jgi:DNA-J related protein./DnaJ domain.|uniref:Heat shock protein DnaJ domain protein n=1 Tax=Marinomonas mediterranea (strain ATCC 700492 / JCM 21426 / NBRC 103028 / MMB-1) TaxID=717774 RepID=F2JZH3_MARM1|nr:DNA-J related domain-containing protein [Marinomonas mediterranea]ADZ89756.1 heat shock protein DnaJ domain protein [Marinomonas mediterranea MMB-1]WCN07848.1 DnaJ domain-containing protein [Marinomonas mediterranea]WCN11943.1 DnaJ domain-containing protein [Marinomonas mediterranea]WCN15980.1 DnaJ domain-containing protein [Marinomonas mediterranea MMB-1]